MMTAKPAMALLAEAREVAPSPPPVDQIVEDAGRQRLAAYYLYSAQLAGLIGADLAPAGWPQALAEPMQRLGLARLAPRTEQGLDAQLTRAEQATRRSQGRDVEFASLLVELINHGAFGPLCGKADHVQLASKGATSARTLELMRGGRVVGACPVQDHWELMAQYLAGAPPGGWAETGTTRAASQAATWLKTSGLAHAVSLGTSLAVGLHPLGAAAGLGTRLVEARIRPDRDQAGALHQLGQELTTLQAEAAAEVRDLPVGRRG